PSTADEATAPEPETVIAAFPVIDQPVPVGASLTRMTDADANAIMRVAKSRAPAPAEEVPDHGLSGAEAAPQPAAGTLTAQRLTPGRSRRRGLGGPLPPQHNPAVQRAADAPRLDLAPPAPPPRPDHGKEGAGSEVAAAGAGRDEPVTESAE